MKHLIVDLDTLIYKAGFASEATLRKVFLDGNDIGTFSLHKDVLEALDEHGVPHDYRLKPKNEEDEGRINIKKMHVVEPEEKAIKTADSLLRGLLGKFEDYKATLYMRGKSPWRYELWPLYKHSRERVPKPVHLEAIVEFYKDKFGAIIPEDMEADDACSVHAYECMRNKDDYIIMSIDKDLLQIPGTHFNYQAFFEGKNGFTYVSPWEGELALYAQILSGDSTDDIPGIKGIGDKTAQKMVSGFDDPFELYEFVYSIYKDHHGDAGPEALNLTANLVYLVRKPNDFWKPPLEL